jgi:hypothetical protein
MLLLNFSHPITPDQIAEIENRAKQPVSRILDINSQVDTQEPLTPQIVAIVDSIELTPKQWQTEPLLINIPSLNFSSAVLLAELHARMGHFPTILWIRRDNHSIPSRYEVADIIDLQAIRDNAWGKRESKESHAK